MLKKSLKSAGIGLLIGSLTFLAVVMSLGPTITITRANILSNWVMSALIGILSMIFESEKTPFILALVAHYCGVLLLVGIAGAYNGWLSIFIAHPVRHLSFVTLIYGLVWLGLQISNWIDVRRMNERLAKRRQLKK
ncbi:DUF3021 domain-containing protein [Latilactobacillus graminis]|uniref:DUF3021 domain-containing protein n=2 Tax=Latilactobacillus graminis TaxID=60519 RepID=A0AA89L4H4_9LACO|nr:DUF3021 domain-containing protein [Latilactobacillus graminis]KRM23779.1 hypothetical protein FC90_GL001462 [Latilactobacillus graminis DSM 20719]QFP80129.1 DUF3021 domain-containing protein [Latilactobacillus graminis]